MFGLRGFPLQIEREFIAIGLVADGMGVGVRAPLKGLALLRLPDAARAMVAFQVVSKLRGKFTLDDAVQAIGGLVLHNPANNVGNAPDGWITVIEARAFEGMDPLSAFRESIASIRNGDFSRGPLAPIKAEEALQVRHVPPTLVLTQTENAQRRRLGRPQKTTASLLATPQQLFLPDSPAIVQTDENRLHTLAQSKIVRLGELSDFDICLATNDRNAKLGDTNLRSMAKRLISWPMAGLGPVGHRRISLIDAAWVRRGVYKALFEIETSTSIYSGLLRILDLVLAVPNIHIEAYIVAPAERREKFMNELSRESFERLQATCKFVPIERLDEILELVQRYRGKLNDPMGMIAESFDGRDRDKDLIQGSFIA